MASDRLSISIQAVIKMCNQSFVHAFCRDQLESEKKRREAIEREKENMEREKRDLMMKLHEYEETTKRAEKGETETLTADHTGHTVLLKKLLWTSISKSILLV